MLRPCSARRATARPARRRSRISCRSSARRARCGSWCRPAIRRTRRSASCSALLQPGDVIIDGGNSRWTDSKQRYLRCKDKGVSFVDAGTSGGVWGLANGYCLMVGGDEDAVKRVEPIFLTLAPKDGYAHVGPSGAGHFSKMVHNGIEYGMLAAYGEGFEILEKSEYDVRLAPARVDLALRLGRALVAAGTARARAQERSATSPRSRAGSPTPARAAGRCRPRSTRTCRRR